MRKSGQIAAVALTIIGVALPAWRTLLKPQALYQGRTMSSWLNDQNIIDFQLAEKVWTGFGTNAVPFLTAQLSARDGVLKKLYWKASPARRYLPQVLSKRLPDLKP